MEEEEGWLEEEGEEELCCGCSCAGEISKGVARASTIPSRGEVRWWLMKSSKREGKW